MKWSSKKKANSLPISLRRIEKLEKSSVLPYILKAGSNGFYQLGSRLAKTASCAMSPQNQKA
tara:strand:- start:302 stop:487 length:186 start_codon:yes stop_codon:yes gene_type:complete